MNGGSKRACLTRQQSSDRAKLSGRAIEQTGAPAAKIAPLSQRAAPGFTRRSVALAGPALLAGACARREADASGAGGKIDLRSAFLYAFGPYEFARSMQAMSGQIATDNRFTAHLPRTEDGALDATRILNRHVHISDLADHEMRTVTAPNNDTLYTSAVLELSGGPVEIVAPDSPDRYMSIAFMNVFTDQFAFIGTRATAGRGGVYWLVGPESDIEPPQGVEVIRSPSNDVWMLARIFVAGAQDLEAARAHQQKISVAPVRADDAPRLFATKATSSSDPQNFLTLTNEVLGRSPVTGHSRRAAAFDKFGLRPGDLGAWRSMPMHRRASWSMFAPFAADALDKTVRKRLTNGVGWIVPPTNLGRYGEHDDVRAGVALIGFGALPLEEAMYFRAVTDGHGAKLDGAKSYRLHLPPGGAPVDAFWSLSMYAPDPSGRVFFYDNDISRYAINSGSDDLVTQKDGSIILAMQPSPPADKSLVWMPTPDGPFQAFFRTYLPQKAIQTGAWTLPSIERA